MKIISLYVLFLLTVLGQHDDQLNEFEVVQTYWLDQPEFTEGLYYDNDHNRIIESTGLAGDSEMRTYRFDDDNGVIVDIQTLFLDDPELFGEGTTRLDDRYYQLSYHDGQIIIFHEENIGEENDRFVVERIAAQPRDLDWNLSEGWGLTTDSEYLYMSDGSNRIFRIAPDDLIDFPQDYASPDYVDRCNENLQFDAQFEIFHPTTGQPLTMINELEFVNGYIYANIWYSNEIVRIEVGHDYMEADRMYDFTVLREITCDRVAQRWDDQDWSSIDVLNGIAYDHNNNEFIMTGKEWPMVFRIALSDNTNI